MTTLLTPCPSDVGILIGSNVTPYLFGTSESPLFSNEERVYIVLRPPHRKETLTEPPRSHEDRITKWYLCVPGNRCVSSDTVPFFPISLGVREWTEPDLTVYGCSEDKGVKGPVSITQCTEIGSKVLGHDTSQLVILRRCALGELAPVCPSASPFQNVCLPLLTPEGELTRRYNRRSVMVQTSRTYCLEPPLTIPYHTT